MLKFLFKGALLVGAAGLLLNALHQMEEKNKVGKSEAPAADSKEQAAEPASAEEKPAEEAKPAEEVRPEEKTSADDAKPEEETK